MSLLSCLLNLSCTDVLIKPDDNVPLNYDTGIIKFDLHCNLVLRAVSVSFKH